jgi:hypothetical protein
MISSNRHVEYPRFRDPVAVEVQPHYTSLGPLFSYPWRGFHSGASAIDSEDPEGQGLGVKQHGSGQIITGTDEERLWRNSQVRHIFPMNVMIPSSTVLPHKRQLLCLVPVLIIFLYINNYVFYCFDNSAFQGNFGRRPGKPCRNPSLCFHRAGIRTAITPERTTYNTKNLGSGLTSQQRQPTILNDLDLHLGDEFRPQLADDPWLFGGIRVEHEGNLSAARLQTRIKSDREQGLALGRN